MMWREKNWHSTSSFLFKKTCSHTQADMHRETSGKTGCFHGGVTEGDGYHPLFAFLYRLCACKLSLQV